jgi:hypothetical protein
MLFTLVGLLALAAPLVAMAATAARRAGSCMNHR